jgi:hypothetical protein
MYLSIFAVVIFVYFFYFRNIILDFQVGKKIQDFESRFSQIESKSDLVLFRHELGEFTCSHCMSISQHRQLRALMTQVNKKLGYSL